jgi:alanyl-tRNA synthetase
MTKRLYYDDPYLQQFDASVIRVAPKGDRLAVWLDHTAFYPTSGGQPFDVGVLGGQPVVDVLDDDDGDIVHVIDVGPSTRESSRDAVDTPSDRSRHVEAGQLVHGTIDWSRRFDHMQQHTGQHVLSAAVGRLFSARTIGFHLGAEVSTIDLNRELATRSLAAAEDEANRIVWEDRPVTIRYATAEEAASLSLRKETLRSGTLRLIDIEGFDLSACGGTHVRRTGAVGLIAVLGAERFKGGQRIEFVCGGRALGRLRTLRDSVAASLRLLSVLPAELPAAIERVQQDVKDQRKLVQSLRNELSGYQADELARGAETHPIGRVVLKAVDADATTLKTIAASVAGRAGHVAVLATPGPPTLVVVARSPDVTLMAPDVIKALTARFGGRGGGKPDLAQAGGLIARAEDLFAEVRRLL